MGLEGKHGWAARWAVLSVATALSLTACAGEVLQGQERVTRDNFGDAWPFTVEAGELRCEGTLGTRSVLFVVDGAAYALNARAEGRRDGRPLEPIWARVPGDERVRKDVRLLVDRALDLCEPPAPAPTAPQRERRPSPAVSPDGGAVPSASPFDVEAGDRAPDAESTP